MSFINLMKIYTKENKENKENIINIPPITYDCIISIQYCIIIYKSSRIEFNNALTLFKEFYNKILISPLYNLRLYNLLQSIEYINYEITFSYSFYIDFLKINLETMYTKTPYKFVNKKQRIKVIHNNEYEFLSKNIQLISKKSDINVCLLDVLVSYDDTKTKFNIIFNDCLKNVNIVYLKMNNILYTEKDIKNIKQIKEYIKELDSLIYFTNQNISWFNTHFSLIIDKINKFIIE